MSNDPYYLRNEVSNSDLTSLKKYFMSKEKIMDYSNALRLGTLVDAIITEPTKIDHFKRTVDEYQYTVDEWEMAKEMQRAWRKNSFCKTMEAGATFQHVSINKDFRVQYDGIEISLAARCKWDLWKIPAHFGGDLKSTACTTQKQFIESIEYFDYDRSRAWYMDIEGAKIDCIIGISKKNFQVFIVPIDRNHWIYKQGKAKYQELAFKWWTLYGGVAA